MNKIQQNGELIFILLNSVQNSKISIAGVIVVEALQNAADNVEAMSQPAPARP